MKQFTRKLLALGLAAALGLGMAAVAEPVIVEGAVDDPSALPAVQLPGEETGVEGLDLSLGDSGLDSEAPAPVGPAANDIVDSGVCGVNLRWTLDSDGLLTISGTGEMDNDTYFFYHPVVRRVVVEEGVTSIGCSAFNGCTELESVSLPDSVQNIYAGAFRECIRLSQIEIPYGVPYVAGYAFANCFSLERITLPESVTEVLDHAFDGCSRLTILGYNGTFAETYASQNGIPFVSLGDPVWRPAPPAPVKTDLSGCRITVKDQVYTGKALYPAVTVALNGYTLGQDTDYTVSYANNRSVGAATVTVMGTGSYTGSATATFAINPAAVKGLKLTAGKGLLKVSWKKASGITGYQLQYSPNKGFTDAREVSVGKAGAVKRTLKGLKKGRTYYVRIRAYRKVDGKTYRSAWSAPKKAKVR